MGDEGRWEASPCPLQPWWTGVASEGHRRSPGGVFLAGGEVQRWTWLTKEDEQCAGVGGWVGCREVYGC